MITESKFIIDKSNKPYIKIKAIDNIPSREDWNEYKRQYVKIFEEEDQFYLLFDTSCLFGLPLNWVKEKAALLQALKPITERKLIGSAVIVNSTIIRGMLRILLTLYPTVRPNKLVTCEDEGMIFLKSIKNLG